MDRAAPYDARRARAWLAEDSMRLDQLLTWGLKKPVFRKALCEAIVHDSVLAKHSILCELDSDRGLIETQARSLIALLQRGDLMEAERLVETIEKKGCFAQFAAYLNDQGFTNSWLLEKVNSATARQEMEGLE